MFIIYQYFLFFSPLLLDYCFIHYIHCVHNMDYGQLNYEIYLCDRWLLCHIIFYVLYNYLRP
jgi:hypothetical protein